MKTITTLTAVAALIAGVSIAAAQGMSPSGGSSSGASKSMGAGSSSSGTSQQQAIGKGRYCIQSTSGTLDCKYASLSACQKAAKGQNCAPNPNSATTGQKQQ